MPDTLRAFNHAGRKKWAEFIDVLKQNPTAAVPHELFESPDLLILPVEDIRIARLDFPTKFDLAAYLAPHIKSLQTARLNEDTWHGVWDWLAAYYFDNLAPLKNGERKIGEKSRYVFNPSWNRRNRHRIAEPCGLFQRHGESSQIFLFGPPSQVSDIEEQASARQAMSSNPNVSRALMTLYWDETHKRPKRKAADTKRSPGSLRRFSDLLLQLERTYDLDSINYEGIISLLPQREFEDWLARDIESVQSL